MEITINLPETYEVVARGMKLPIDMAAFVDAVLVQACLHGIKQTVADAASNAAGSAYDGARKEHEPLWKDLDAKARKTWATDNASLVELEAEALMKKRIAALLEGDWTTRASAAPGMSKFEEYCAELVAGKMEFEKGTRKPEKLQAGLARYQELAKETQNKIGKLVAARIEREREEEALGLDLDF